MPWRNRVFGHVAKLGLIGCAAPPLSNWLARTSTSRWLTEKILGIDRRRLPPSFATKTLVQRFPSLQNFDESDPRERRVLLFPDTFTNYFEPQVGADAIALFHRGGCSVTFGPPGLHCCGRPLISNGLLGQAVINARHNVELLHEWASRGGPIITCEPSCILTIKDDYPALLKGGLRSTGRNSRSGLPNRRGVSHINFGTGAECPTTLEKGATTDLGSITLSPAFPGRQRTDAQVIAIYPRCRGNRSGCRLLWHGRVVRL